MESLISVFSVGFYTFLIIAVIGLGLAIFTFIKFRIPSVVSLMTGNAQRRSVEMMKASGVLRTEAELENDKTYAGLNDANGMRTEDYMTQEIGPYSATTVQDTTILEAAQDTQLLQPEQETMVLETARRQSAVFQVEDDPETSVLGSIQPSMNGDTQELSGGNYIRTERSYGETQVLDRNAPPAPEVNFECIEHVMITHTDEVI